MAHETIITEGDPVEAARVPPRRISWGAVFAGVVAALVVQLVLGVIGLSFGAASINPLQESAPAAGLTTRAGIWFAVSALIALFVGGWVAGRMAGLPRRLDSALHGLLAWGLATLLMVYFLSSAAGGLISGATGVLGRGLAALGGNAADLTTMLVEQGREQLRESGLDMEDLRREALSLLRDTEKPELQPETLGATGERLGDAAKERTAEAAKEPLSADETILDLIDRMIDQSKETLSAADRDAAINVLVNRTNMSREEAGRTIDQWQQVFQQAQERYAALRETAEQKAREAGANIADNLARTAGWSAFAMILGGIAAAFGGLVGTPRDYSLTESHIGFQRDETELQRE